MRRTIHNRFVELKQSDIPRIRRRLLREQRRRCPICLRHITPDRACLDHSHKKRLKGTGRVRGVLCRTCNVFLAKSENNCVRYCIPILDLPSTLRRMAAYLEKPHTAYVHPSERPPAPRLMKSSYNKLKAAREMFHTYLERRRKLPNYPRKGRMTKNLARMFEQYGIEPEFYA